MRSNPRIESTATARRAGVGLPGWVGDTVRAAAHMDAVLDRMTRDMELEGYIADDRDTMCLAVREAILNALQHGNRGDRSRDVWVRYHVDPSRVVAEVEDQGDGFDPSRTPDPRRPEHLAMPGGRGLFLMSALVNWVRFNGRGNRVTLCKKRSYAE